MNTTGTPAAEYRLVADRFTELVFATQRLHAWDLPSPVAEWRARDIIGHLVGWFPPFLAGGTGIHLPTGPSIDDDPVVAWQTMSEAIQALLDDPASADMVLDNPHVGQVPLAQAVSRFFTGDVFMHTWDLARAIGLDANLDPRRCTELLDGLAPIEDILRNSGQYGPRVTVAEDAGPEAKLIAFIGRDPHWQSPAQPVTGPAAATSAERR